MIAMLNRPMPKWWLLVLLLALLAAALAVGLFWRAPAAAALVVQVAPLVRTLQFSARVATASRVDVGATVTGRVSGVQVREGAQVKAGDVLLELEDAEWRAALAQSLAGEQQAAARLAGLRSTGRSGVRAGVAQTESVLLAAGRDLQRTQELVQRGFLSAARLDEAQRAMSVAQAQQAAALAQAGAIAERGTDVQQAQAQQAQAQASTQVARARLAQAIVTAPAAGRVLTRSVEPGQIVQPGRALFTLALTGSLQLVAPVDERFLQQLQPGQTAQVRADAFPDQRFAAQLLSISPLVDAQRGSVDVKFSVPQVPSFLREDMTLSVEVETARRASALVVPLAALRGGGGNAAAPPAGASDSAIVWVAQDGRVQARALKLGLRTLDAAEVLQGLATGDEVLLGASPAPGSRVRAVTTAAAAALASRAGVADAGSALTNAMGR
jgi:HlyD family secretion protein